MFQLNKSVESNEKEKLDINNMLNNEQKSATPKLKLSLPINITNSKKNLENSTEGREKSPTSVKDVKDIILAGSKNIIGKVLSPAKDKLDQENSKKVDIKKPILMTRRELTDPFGSDDEEEEEELNKADNKILNSKIPEVNGDKIVANGDIKERKDDVTDLKVVDLPKPNPVSVFILNCSSCVFIQILLINSFDFCVAITNKAL